MFLKNFKCKTGYTNILRDIYINTIIMVTNNIQKIYMKQLIEVVQALDRNKF